MKVVIRTDSSIKIGSGHLFRCLTLAKMLKRRGAEVTFVCRDFKGNYIDKLDQEGYRVKRLPYTSDNHLKQSKYSHWLGVTQEQDATDTLKVLGNQKIDLLIVDHYSLSFKWEIFFRPRVRKIMVLDDLANRNHDCDFLLDQNYFGKNTVNRYQDLVPKSAVCLLGPEYALLQEEYRHFRLRLLPNKVMIKKVLVFFGASDSENYTEKVIQALSRKDMAQFHLDVVIGRNHPCPQKIKDLVLIRPKSRIYFNLPSLAGLMVQADLMVCAGGATTWERMCLGVPSIVIPIADNQHELTRALSQGQFQISIDKEKILSKPDYLYKCINSFIQQTNLIKKISENSKKLVDGLGAKRVANILYKN